MAVKLWVLVAVGAAAAGAGAAATAAPRTVMLNITRPAVTQTYLAEPGGLARPGRVTIRFCVDRAGNTKHLVVVRSTPAHAFDGMALAIMRAATFEPHRIDGVPVAACGITQTIEFKPVRSG